MKTIALITAFFAQLNVFGQTFTGKVIDGRSGDPLPYVRIGIEGKNAGTISHENGDFTLALTGIKSDSITFSMLGYERMKISHSDLLSQKVVRLMPKSYTLKEVTVTAKEIVEMKKLGRPDVTKVTIGHSGNSQWGTGSEWGLKIQTQGEKFHLQNVAFHTRFNTLDSVLYRIHIYSLSDNLPDAELLKRELYVKSYKKDKWIIKNIKDQNLVMSGEFGVTVEIVRLWYNKTGDNELFFTYGKDPARLPTYSRESSLAQWEVDKMPPLALYVEGRKLE